MLTFDGKKHIHPSGLADPILINQEVHSQIPHVLTKMNDNINMDSTIAGLMNTHSWLATN